jgi:15-cis-phytoene synthase
MTSNPDRAALIAFARDSIARGSKSFAAASRLFDQQTRERAWLLYAWCRAADDLADGQDMGHGMTAVTDPQERFVVIREHTEAALAGRATGTLAFDALAVVMRECRIPERYPRDLVEGFGLDAAGFMPRHEDDLYRYCYHVAGAVGCMMAIVMGVRPDDSATLDRACDLGMAFQLANIARDIAEDDAADRCYLPLDWLAEMDIPPGEILKPPYRPRLAVLAKRLADKAEAYEASARFGTRMLPFRSAWAVLAAAGIYGDIARQVRELGGKAWDHRVTTSHADKLLWMIRGAFSTTTRRYIGDPGRDGLWTRPT